jgi:DMSO/TMAO reductase YedYZ heme-binding membrane subunit
VAWIVGASVAYAVLRYNVLAGVAWAELPLYVSNKGISLASAALVAVAYLSGYIRLDGKGREDSRRLARTAGLAGFALALVHIVASFAVLTAAHYPQLFRGGDLSEVGWVCLAGGVLAALLLTFPAVYSLPRLLPFLGVENWKRAQQLGYPGLALTALHVFLIGNANWLSVSRWPGGMPPISLISFLICLAPILVKLGSVYRARYPSKSFFPRTAI